MSKRIAIVASSCPPVSAGGVSSAHYHLFLALKRKGHDVRMFTFGDYGAAQEGREIIRAGTPPWVDKVVAGLTRVFFRVVDPGKTAYHTAEVLSALWPCAGLRSTIRQFAPDVLILPDHGAPGFAIGKPKRCKVILVSHHNPARFLGNPLWGLHSAVDSQLTIRCENAVLRNVDTVVCPSQYMKAMFTATYGYTGEVVVVPNLMDSDLLSMTPARDIRSELGLPEDAVLVYIPSAGSAYKGGRFVGEIIRRLASQASKEIGFYLSGPLDAALSYELRFAPSNAKIYAPGQIVYAENVAIVKSCSFGVSPTLVDNYSMALLEAGACGVPMVSFDVGGNPEVIAHGRSGVLVPYLDLDALIYAAGQLLDNAYRMALRTTTLQHAAGRLSNDSVVEQFEQVMDAPGR